ncbi:8-amino-3,8-dideoxy-manno-octulosonate cytidylyltransferase [Candidatus Entotheonellaceae bacterium PAL068K]
MRTLLVIPARYGSTRLPGKPLAKIAGRTMLSRVYSIAQAAAQNRDNVDLVVATDDERIATHCADIGATWVMTSASCPSGTDRALEAVKQLDRAYDCIVNLQGDAPLTPPDFITAMLHAFEADPTLDVLTPVVQLRWEALDRLRADKQQAPFSGTCVIVDQHGNALWFSKHIIPALRQEAALRQAGDQSPVFRHIGLYAYSRQMLETYVTLPSGYYEQLEGLEQLRILEHGYRMRVVQVDYQGRASMSGVDSPADLKRAEELIAIHGELLTPGKVASP